MKNIVPCGVLLTLLTATTAQAAVSFDLHDESPSWGYLMDSGGNVWEDPRLGSPHDPWDDPPGMSFDPTEDEYGTPVFNFSTGTVTFDGAGNLLSITIDYESPNYRSLWHILKPGDLFLDVENDGTYDYVARTPFYAQSDYSADGLYSSNSWDLYRLSSPVDYLHDRDEDGIAGNEIYQLAEEAGPADSDSTGWPGVLVRGYHPWAFTDDFINNTDNAEKVTDGEVDFDGWDDLTPAGKVGSSTWTFSSDSLPNLWMTELGIGFTVNCANEVLLGDVTCTPEPGTIVVWGVLAAAAWLGIDARRRRRVK